MDTRKCENCGEYYSVTYKRCPFCDDDESDVVRAPARRSGGGGKRLASNTRGGGYGRPRGQFMRIFALALSLVLIVAAICIVISIVRTVFHLGGSESPSGPSVTTEASSNPSDSTVAAQPTETAPADTTPAVEPTVPGTSTGLPKSTAATGFTLSSSDITLFSAGEKAQLTAKLTPEGTSGTVSWTSSNPAVATVNSSGLVTAVSSGTAKVTAKLGDTTKTCVVRCNFKTGATVTSTTPTSTTAPADTAKLTLNRTDFTLLSAGETFRLTASGASGSVAWSIGNPAVATIDQNGKVTAVANGVTTVTATSGAAKTTCIVRVTIS